MNSPHIAVRRAYHGRTYAVQVNGTTVSEHETLDKASVAAAALRRAAIAERATIGAYVTHTDAAGHTMRLPDAECRRCGVPICLDGCATTHTPWCPYAAGRPVSEREGTAQERFEASVMAPRGYWVPPSVFRGIVGGQTHPITEGSESCETT